MKMMKPPGNKKFNFPIVALFLLVVFWAVDMPSAGSRALRGRLIKLKVTGSEDVATMMKGFLTSHDLVLVDDHDVPILRVEAKEECEGSTLNRKVTYHIESIELQFPEIGLVYSSSGISAHEYGEDTTARSSALYLLREYLSRDETLFAKLDEVAIRNYYDLGPPEGAHREKLETIERKILELAIKLERNQELRERMKQMEMQQLASNQRLAELASAIRQEGSRRASRQSVLKVLHYQKQMLRAMKHPYLVSNSCEQSNSRSYDAIEAVLIRVPVEDGRGFRTGEYGVYADNQSMVYEKSGQNRGPRWFGSMDLLKKSTLGRYFRSKNRFLDIRAVAYHPEDHAIIISGCDADAVMLANIRGSNPNRIFAEGRVVLVPGAI